MLLSTIKNVFQNYLNTQNEKAEKWGDEIELIEEIASNGKTCEIHTNCRSYAVGHNMTKKEILETIKRFK